MYILCWHPKQNIHSMLLLYKILVPTARCSKVTVLLSIGVNYNNRCYFWRHVHSPTCPEQKHNLKTYICHWHINQNVFFLLLIDDILWPPARCSKVTVLLSMVVTYNIYCYFWRCVHSPTCPDQKHDSRLFDRLRPASKAAA